MQIGRCVEGRYQDSSWVCFVGSCWNGRADPNTVGGEEAEGELARARAHAEGVVVVARDGREGDAGPDAEGVEELEEAGVALVEAGDYYGRTDGGIREA